MGLIFHAFEGSQSYTYLGPGWAQLSCLSGLLESAMWLGSSISLSLSSVLSDGSEHSYVNHGPLSSLHLNMVYFVRIFEPLLVLRITFGNACDTLGGVKD